MSKKKRTVIMGADVLNVMKVKMKSMGKPSESRWNGILGGWRQYNAGWKRKLYNATRIICKNIQMKTHKIFCSRVVHKMIRNGCQKQNSRHMTLMFDFVWILFSVASSRFSKHGLFWIWLYYYQKWVQNSNSESYYGLKTSANALYVCGDWFEIL